MNHCHSPRVVTRRAPRDSGLSLVEVLVSVVLIGLAVISVLGALGGSLIASAQHRKHATTDTLLRSAAELITGPATTYVTCANAATYASALPADPTGTITVTIQSVEYWTGTAGGAFDTSCSNSSDPDLNAQRITLLATSSDGRLSETMQFVKRRLTGGTSSAGSATTTSTTTATTIMPASTSRALTLLGTSSRVLQVSGGGKMTITGDPFVTTTSNKWAKTSGKSTLYVSGTTYYSAGDPYSTLAVPTSAGTVFTNGVYQGPGIYRTTPLTITANTTMAAGNYFLEAGMTISGSAAVTGTGVFLFNGCATGAAASCANGGSITISTSGTVTLTGPTTGTYAGMVLFQHRSNTKDVEITATAARTLDRVYAAGAKVLVSGSSSAVVRVAGVIAKTMTVNRSAETLIGPLS